MARLGQVKGSLLVHLRGFVLRKHGEAAWEDVLERLPTEDQKVFESLLMMGGWYPVGIWNRAIDRYLPTYFVDPMSAMMDLSAHIAREDLTTLYKLILKVGTPGFIMGKAGSLWGRYFDTGILVPKELAPRKWHLELAGSRLEDEAPSVFSCEGGVCGWLTSGLKLTGATLHIEQTRCRFGGSPSCEYEASW
jgi:hypothetical protein